MITVGTAEELEPMDNPGTSIRSVAVPKCKQYIRQEPLYEMSYLRSVLAGICVNDTYIIAMMEKLR